jgi:hypothetical protein
MADAARGANPLTDIKGKGFKNMLTGATGLGGRIPAINLDEGSSVPFGLILHWRVNFPQPTSLILFASE